MQGADEKTVRTLDEVALITPENIHLNSFMYEPIIDMSDKHLRRLYSRVEVLILIPRLGQPNTGLQSTDRKGDLGHQVGGPRAAARGIFRRPIGSILNPKTLGRHADSKTDVPPEETVRTAGS